MRILLSGLMLLALLGLGCAGRSTSEPEPRPRRQREQPSSVHMSALDAELERHWAALDVEPSPLASDAEFLRRASLDLIGRVPTRIEIEEFLADDGADKRARKVDALLDSEEFATHWAGIWSDALLSADARVRRIAGESLEGYFVEALAENRSWAVVVDELLASEGQLNDTAQLGFLVGRAARGVPREELAADLSSTTARVFLGAKIECAQCHDHPYQPDFTREDFWAQAAFFGRTAVAFDRSGNGPPTAEVSDRTRGELRVALGGDEDPRKRAIAPRFMGSKQEIEFENRRAELVTAIVADPRFAEATVGQVWTRLLGRGIVEPWDDLLDEHERPELLSLLAAEFRASDHDLRALIRSIVLSQAYQRSSAGPQTEATKIAAAEAAFARAAVRPLSAEQLFASLITVTGLEQVEGRAFRRLVEDRREQALREYQFVFSDDEMASADAFSGSVPQALLLLNGGLSNQGVVARSGSGLDQILAAEQSTDARLEDLWLTVYGRSPSTDELALGRAAVGDGSRTRDWEDLMFAMLYSSEFSSNH
jgi:hypothetical protein